VRRLLLASAFMAGCRKDPTGAGDAARSEGRYDVASPGEGWVAQRPGGADKAWFHPDLGAAIYTDSNCGSRFEDSPLADLATHLTYGIARGAPTREERLELDGREALLRVHDGALDGVAVTVGAIVTKKHRCTYDMLFISAPASFEAGWPAFVGLSTGFRVRAR